MWALSEIPGICTFLLFPFETASYYVVVEGLELMTLQGQLPEFWHYKTAPERYSAATLAGPLAGGRWCQVGDR